MTRTRRVVALAALLAGGMPLVSAPGLSVPPAQAADGLTLQVSREVTVASGGTAVPLTARISSAATGSGVTVHFEAEGGPADTHPVGTPEQSCHIPAGQTACSVQFAASDQGTSLIRAYLAGTAVDRAEGRLANDELIGTRADCVDGDRDGVTDLLLTACRTGPVQPGSIPEPDATDVVQITWTSFSAARLNCDDSDPRDGPDTAYKRLHQRAEQYTCTVMTMATPPVPIAGAYVDGRILSGPGADANPGKAHFDNFCGPTDGHGRCQGTVTIGGTGPAVADICFWAEPGNQHDDRYDINGDDIDGGGCRNEPLHEPENNDNSDVVRIDIDNPRASGLDAGPEHQVLGPGSRFKFAAVVYDQFGDTFPGDVTVYGEYFVDSPLDGDGNTPSTPDFSCQTKDQGGCAITTPPQQVLGTNLACLWIVTPQSPAPRDSRFFGNHLDGSCEDEIPTDPTADDGRPFPVTDAIDIIRMTIQSRPQIGVVEPAERRQDTDGRLQLSGANFLNGARLAVSGAGIRLGPTVRYSDTALEATIEIAAGAPAGARDVTVTNPDGGTTICRGCFRVIGQGYWMVASDGGIFAFGDAPFAGSAGDRAVDGSMAGMAATPSGAGYWLAASDGSVFAFGDARHLGSAAGLPLNHPIVGIAAHPTGQGYWLVASDGGIFTFGQARFYGSTGRLRLTAPIVGIAASPTGRGYWLVGADGGIFSFGDARFFGSTGDIALNQPIVAMASTGDGRGYWLVASDGGVFAFGNADFKGSTGGIALNRPIVAMATTPTVAGYWLVASDGGIFAFGDAGFFGSTGDIALNRPIVGMARR